MTDVSAGAGSIPLVSLLDAVLAATAVEGVALAAYRRRTGRGMPVREVASFLGAGLALLLALRLLAASAPFIAVALAMLAALALHVRHVAERWER